MVYRYAYYDVIAINYGSKDDEIYPIDSVIHTHIHIDTE